MARTESSHAPLSEADQRQVCDWVIAFARTWHTGQLKHYVTTVLPPVGRQLRMSALVELASLDLRRRWEAGDQKDVRSYQTEYPELGVLANAPLELVLAEFEARQQAGVAWTIEQAIERYPHLAAELRARITGQRDSGTAVEQAESSVTPPMLVSSPREHSPVAAIRREPGEEFGRYRIQKTLGKGGMGTVYLAHDRQLDRRVAIKIPDVHGDNREQILQRFYREARIAAKIEHPNICPIYDVGEHAGLPYLSMAYVEGTSLGSWTRAHALRPQLHVAQLIRKLALTLAEAHKSGIVHRDMKPSNVMLRSNGEPVIMDFGVARAAPEQTLIREKGIVGTLEYMSPEQVLGHGEDIGPFSDVYSLGVMLYQLLTGRLPFEGLAASIVYKIVHVDPPAPNTHRPEIDGFLTAICMKAIAKKPAERYATMDDFAAALDTYVRETHSVNEPTLPMAGTRPPSQQSTDVMPSASGLAQGRNESHATAPIHTPQPSKPRERLVTPAPTAGRGPATNKETPPVAKQRGLAFVLALGTLLALGILGFLLVRLLRPEWLQFANRSTPTATAPTTQREVVAPTKADASTPTKPSTTANVKPGHVRIRVNAPAGAINLQLGTQFPQSIQDGEALELEPGSYAVVALEGERVLFRGNVDVKPDGETLLDIPLAQLVIRGLEPPPTTSLQGELGDVPFALDQPVVRVQTGANRLRVKHDQFTYVDRQANLSNGGKEEVVLGFKSSLGMNLALIPAGTFTMGAPKDESLPYQQDETPHAVQITKPFFMGTTEVTQAQYEKVMGVNPSRAKLGGDYPVENVTWDEANAFCKKLSELAAEKAAGRKYRLPTEAEWEHACRAATRTPFASGTSLSGKQANFNGDFPYPDDSVAKVKALGGPTKVASYNANPFGLFDVHGNVAEWVNDRFDPEYYRRSPPSDPQGPPSGSTFVLRGGSWKSYGRECRSADRATLADPRVDLGTVGFRVVCEVR